MEEAHRLCDRIAIINGGCLITLDTPSGLKSSVPGANDSTSLNDVFVHYTGRGLRETAAAGPTFLATEKTERSSKR
jgi:ABC-2 type transport system ATP-binding protein